MGFYTQHTERYLTKGIAHFFILSVLKKPSALVRAHFKINIPPRHNVPWGYNFIQLLISTIQEK